MERNREYDDITYDFLRECETNINEEEFIEDDSDVIDENFEEVLFEEETNEECSEEYSEEYSEDDDIKNEDNKKDDKDFYSTNVNMGNFEININSMKFKNPAELLLKLYDIRMDNTLTKEEKNIKSQEIIKQYTR
ncbi:hypothetical protein CLPU_10c01200 [Gottschalkia purinilytica]|uniref:Uncharacterized protein n=1 Tax=Gottschalkia purinilytica TaxID=1503 RepID=A0A0L0W9T7_GOTPU|nr:hypothetical protein [Gottschalkia purinilytica]KNF08065.1 hypothetical protein CLPU_10c01200 [Gottschalkia purinilytica]